MRGMGHLASSARVVDSPDGLELIGKVLATGVGTAQAKERKRSVGVQAFGSSGRRGQSVFGHSVQVLAARTRRSRSVHEGAHV